jgi:NADH dehydrogenase FAD-containing subunit
MIERADIDSLWTDHLIGTPLAFASTEYAAKAWTLFQDIPALQTPAVKFVRGSITGVDSENKFATIAEHGSQRDVQIPYDYFVAATGLRRAAPSAPQALSKKQYIVETANHIRTAQAATEGVIVVGAGKYTLSKRPYTEQLTYFLGAVGIEIAAELKLLMPDVNVTLIHSRSKLLSSEPLPDEFKDRALQLVHEAGVGTILGVRVVDTIENKASGSEVLLSDGRRVKADLVINAVSKFHPTTTYLPSTVLDDDGYVKIKPR